MKKKSKLELDLLALLEEDSTLTEEEMAEIAKLDGTKKYYHADEEQVEKYATMHLPFEG